eukprot:scaffold922_cov327-Pinguiococcus_pyrenoidosus.AAC.4
MPSARGAFSARGSSTRRSGTWRIVRKPWLDRSRSTRIRSLLRRRYCYLPLHAPQAPGDHGRFYQGPRGQHGSRCQGGLPCWHVCVSDASRTLTSQRHRPLRGPPRAQRRPLPFQALLCCAP